jgi:hypothetical protein
MRSRPAWRLATLFLVARAVTWACPAAYGAEAEFSAEDVQFFETKVRPLLVERCHECHSTESNPAKGNLSLDSRGAALTGGDSGPAVVPGDPEGSLLVDAVRYGDVFKMPPKGKLPEAEIAIFVEWVRRGAPWPDEAGHPPAAADGPQEFTAEQRDFWAFRPPADPTIPPVVDTAWPASPMDAFVLAGLEEAGLAPAAPADKRTLIRRATFDLTGLPPSPQDVEAFLADDSPRAFERVIERLLASPQYGERWGRHWLDVARYADSNGMDENLAFAHAWRYRDWVVAAFNRDLPYDEFVRQQVAGDLLPAADDAERFERIVATGFLSLGPKMLAEDDPVKMEMDIIDEQVDAVGRAFLGLTLGCARCHDHKFDPVTTEDYYALAGIFKSTKTMENFSVVAVWNERPLATTAELAQVERLKQQAAAVRGEADRQAAAANEALLAEARLRAADYLLAAALAERQTALASLMTGTPPSGAIVVESEAYARGNARIDLAGYGEGIGVIYNAGELPNVAEYDVAVPAAGGYQVELRYAAADARPVWLSIDGRAVRTDAAGQVTGTWYPDTQAWHAEALVRLNEGTHVIRLECAGPFPHFDKLALVPRAAPEGTETAGLPDADQPAAEGTPPDSASKKEEGLNPAFFDQWRRYLARTRRDPTALLYAWHVAEAALLGEGDGAVDPAAGPAAARLLAEPRPSSLAELAERYRGLFAQAEEAWQAQAAGPAGAAASALADPVLEAARLVLRDAAGPLAVPDKPERFYPAETAAQIEAMRKEAADIEATIPEVPRAMAVEDRQPVDLPVHIRGNHLTLGPSPIPRGFPEIISGPSPPSIDAEQSGRRQLAEWLAAPDHPLTSRVLVNRVWRWHFGEGLVRSPDNFGLLGERPTHPELLDWLARRFVEDGWSIKALHRRIMLSSTYRMGTSAAVEADSIDPENRLWRRFNRRRLEAEEVRDALLAASGQLDLTQGGSLLKSKDREYVASTTSVNTANYESQRRSVYLPVVRSALYEVFQAFDFADPSALNGDRETTTVAPQALFMLNSSLVRDATRAMAERLLADPSADDAKRIDAAYRLAVGRPADQRETARGLAFLARYEQAVAGAQADPAERRRAAWQGLCRALVSSNEFIFIE